MLNTFNKSFDFLSSIYLLVTAYELKSNHSLNFMRFWKGQHFREFFRVFVLYPNR